MAKSKKLLEIAVAAALFAGCAGMAVAQDAAGAIAARQGAMKAVGGAAAKLRSANGDAEVLKAAGKTINDNLKVFAANLPAGSGAGSGAATKAKDEIWSDSAGFKAALDAALAASDGLANGSDPAAAAAGVGRSCGGCHTKYRAG